MSDSENISSVIKGADHCFVIAEIGVNHNGDLELAHQLVEAAAHAGADAIKFQTFSSHSLVTETTKRARYQVRNTGQEGSQLEMLQSLELSKEGHFELSEHCSALGKMFLSSPFDAESLAFLVDGMDLPLIKVASGEISNGPFLYELAQTGKPLIISTGMASLDDVRVALGVLAHGYLKRDVPSNGTDAILDILLSTEAQEELLNKVAVLHCTTEYPAPPESINLRAMETMREAFGLIMGFSDHSLGTSIPIAAVARGAKVIEKHFTLDRNMAGPDHKASLEPGDFSEMVEGIRTVERALGCGRKMPNEVELDNRSIARKSLIAAVSIRAGDLWEPRHLTAKRAGGGMSPMAYWNLLGKPASRSYEVDELIEE